MIHSELAFKNSSGIKNLWLLSLIVIIAAAVFPQNSYSQDKKVPETKILYSGSTNAADISSFTTVKPEDKQFSSEKKDLLSRLSEARLSGNTEQKDQLESKLNKMDGVTTVTLQQDPNIIGESVKQEQTGDFHSAVINPNGIWSGATQTITDGLPHARRIWVAATVLGPSDTCKFYYSDDNGQTWTNSYRIYFSNVSHFNAGELDLEMAYDGTSMWIYGVAGYKDASGRKLDMLFRINETASIVYTYSLAWPGISTSANQYYNPRITSDNTIYSYDSYMYISSAFDSTNSSNQHFSKLKYAHITTPFTSSISVSYYMPQGGSFYWSSPVPANSYGWYDIAYCQASGTDRVITVFNNPASGLYNFYIAFSDDYGSTITNANILYTSQPNYGTRMAFCGGLGDYNGLIAYVIQFSPNDWDALYTGTTNSGSTWSLGGAIDNDGNRVRSIDIKAKSYAYNEYKFAYTKQTPSGTYGYYRSYGSSSSVQITPAGIDTSFTKVIAGYQVGIGDPCFALYSGNNGVGIFASNLCSTTVGTGNNNNEIPTSYKLEQNYPNPFNPTTNIKFSIPRNSKVKVTVYDMTGKIAAVLVDGDLKAGNYNYDFNAANIASGVYFYKLETEGFSEVKKMMLIK